MDKILKRPEEKVYFASKGYIEACIKLLINDDYSKVQIKDLFGTYKDFEIIYKKEYKKYKEIKAQEQFKKRLKQ